MRWATSFGWVSSVVISIQTNADQFNKTLQEYIALRKRDLHQEVRRKARDVAFRLGGFKGRAETRKSYVSPTSVTYARRGVSEGGFGPPVQSTPERIQRKVEASNWAIGRRGDSLAPAGKYGVSKAASDLADAMMEGQKRQMFTERNGMLQPARFSKQKKRVRLLQVQKGPNASYKWRTRGRGFHALNESELEQVRNNGSLSGGKMLNAAQIAKAIEVRLRKRAAIGGTLRAQWLMRRWNYRRVAGTSENYETKNKMGKMLGRAEIRKEQVTLSGMVPGTAKFGGVIGTVLREATEDMRDYIRDRMLRQFKQGVLKQVQQGTNDL